MEYKANGLYDLKQTKNDNGGLGRKVTEEVFSPSMSDDDSWPYPGGTGNTPPTGDPDDRYRNPSKMMDEGSWPYPGGTGNTPPTGDPDGDD